MLVHGHLQAVSPSLSRHTDIDMPSRVPPGIPYLARGLLKNLVPPSLAVVAARRVLHSYFNAFVPTWLFVLVLLATPPVVVAVHINVTAYRNKREADRMGAVLAPRYNGKWIGNWDLTVKFMQEFENGYPGACTDRRDNSKFVS